MGKSERLMQLELLLLSHPEGMRRAEIARRLGVHRSTVGRYVDELKKKVDLWEDEYVVGISNDEPMNMMKLSVYESLAFHLSAELLANHTEYHNPHMSSALRKLAENLRRNAPSMSASIDSMAEAIETGSKLQNPDYIKVLETMTDSWVSGKIVRIKHLNEKTGKEEETEFAPYFIGFYDQNGARRPISVTGRLRHTAAIQTIDIRKIHSAEILDETYTIPDNLKPFGKNEFNSPIESEDLIPLKLRIRERSVLNVFHNLYVNRLKVHDPESDGWIICDIEAENSIELFLKLVQCGPSVEILEPSSYRQKFIREIQKIASVYHLSGTSSV
ncbi:helix-turn-helix transcriptional regulator [Sediminispirochaeta smaragdinae]|uniref:Regulatory protein, DeoR n=1 Tax=Sediminispirochaeta smaragdinae (strain DSM 11293 / JCM 15392 / SEBR 4228) TaxID=573413 RepID=E1RBL5_SEDSS|nr:WYL domain-containing protein [Sediminispirochaeta smaragdinae]ADK79745.1 regulatory protein, DeoR [Sediminispirochaeta smaragdinae DSM 11293]